MNVLITGADSFIAKELVAYFSQNQKIDLIPATRSVLDVVDSRQVCDFFESNDIDVVIHTAVKGGKRNHKQHIDDFLCNIAMFNNLANCSHKYSIMFNFGSGAEFDRNSDIKLVKEQELHNYYPKDYYGLSKNLISRKISDLNSKIFNLRLFGCFGEFEEEQRFIKASFEKIKNGQPITIHQNRFMDYFYAQDVGKVIDYIIHNTHERLPRDINLCYERKYKLTDIANIIFDLTNCDQSVIIDNNVLGKSYTGYGQNLKNLNIELYGLKQGINACLKNWNRY